MSMNLTKLAKKLVHDSRNKNKNTDSSAGFHQNQLESICVFSYWLVFAQPLLSFYNTVRTRMVLVEPATPTGTPATMTILSPGFTRPCSRATFSANSNMSSVDFGL